jgi:class 3 adenylate cyclase/tetratricopeptide (TPR) repeat protein
MPHSPLEWPESSESRIWARTSLFGQRRFVTVLVADVSGASEIAEQNEAEQVAAALSELRTCMRWVIQRHGGVVARLQGDGVLALFSAEGAESDGSRRAARAALELHTLVERLRVGSATTGRVLRLHSGLHGGQVLMVEGGIEVGRFDVVGEVAQIATALCGLAAGGEVLASVEALGPHTLELTAGPSRHVVIEGRATALEVVALAPVAEALAPVGREASEPVPEPQRLIGQRRYLTVLFADVSNSMEHAERRDAEIYASWLSRFRESARDVVSRHGGVVARLQGDGMMALFGATEMHDDDGRRAVEAALELHALMRPPPGGHDAGLGSRAPQLRSGVHAGLVLVLEGDIEVGRYDVVGEVPNTAARLCSLAAGSEIVVSDEALGPHRHFFEGRAEKDVSIRGRSTRIDLVRVARRSPLQRRIDSAAQRGTVPFAGREPALQSLLAAANDIRTGGSRVVVVTGEPGIGKTRLLDEFRRQIDVRQFLLLQGSCEDYLAAEPMQPFAQALRAALGWRPDATAEVNAGAMAAMLATLGEEPAKTLAPLAHALAGSPREVASQPGGAAPSPIRASAVAGMVKALASRRTPVILLLDDWQWADDASRQVLTAALKDISPLLVVLGMRPGTPAEDVLADAQQVVLEPLQLSEGERLITAWLPWADPFMVEDIYGRSGGSPLFLEEMCHVAATGGELKKLARGAGMAWLNALIAARVAPLPESEAQALRVAAVAGNGFALSLLGDLLRVDDIAKLADALVSRGFLMPASPEGMLRFKHALTREAVYGTVALDQRQALHGRIAKILEAHVAGEGTFDWLEALAYHYHAAGDFDPAARYAEAAGDKALAAAALDRARTHYITALRSLDAQAPLQRPAQLRWCSIAQRLGQTCVFDPLNLSKDIALFGRAADVARQAGDENAIARAEYWLAYINYGKGRTRLAVRHSEAALSHAQRSGDQRLVAQVTATLGQSLAAAGSYSRALPLLAQAVESKRQQARPGNNAAIGSAYARARHAYSLGDIGRFDDAQELFAEALALLGPNLHPVMASVHELICAVHLWQGRWLDAQQAGLTGADFALRCQSHYLVAMGRALSACGAWAASADAAALQTLRETTRWIESRGGAVSTSLNYGWLVEATASLGLTAEARRHAVQLVQRARMDDRHGLPMGWRALARLDAAAGAFARAHRRLDLADRVADQRGSRRELALNDLTRAGVLAAAGRAAQGRACAERAAEAFQDMRMAWHLDKAQALAREL